MWVVGFRVSCKPNMTLAASKGINLIIQAFLTCQHQDLEALQAHQKGPLAHTTASCMPGHLASNIHVAGKSG